jgi:hypothetical protein
LLCFVVNSSSPLLKSCSGVSFFVLHILYLRRLPFLLNPPNPCCIVLCFRV